ncbi:Acetyltransferase (GNAT) family protein [compost metagenome]
MKFRKANITDAEEIARVHVDSWRTTYKNIVSDSYLSQLSVERRKNNWEWTFKNLNKGEVIYVGLNDEDDIIGFACGGQNREKEFEYDGELYAIYLLRETQGHGYGKKLFKLVVESLQNSGYKSMMVWVLQGNTATNFYSAMGGELIGQKEIIIGEDKHIELAYGWRNI